MVSTAPYGAWRSPIDVALTAAHDGSPEHVGVVGDEVWWTAPHPAEGAGARWCAGAPAAPRNRCWSGRGTCAAGSWSTAARLGPPSRALPAGRWWSSATFEDQRLYAYEPDAAHTGAGAGAA